MAPSCFVEAGKYVQANAAGLCKTRIRTGGCGRRMADGALKKKPREKKIARMLILLNFLVNCHLLRNASFGYFFFNLN